ncbi:MAG: diguanylate cyclase [Candidatus Omnitrophota bacterium]|nr:diguanylate cyclase [Candidatus Omnitrophota bacterium]
MKHKFSIQSLSLKRKIFVAVSLVTFIPLIVLLFYPSGPRVAIHIKMIAVVLIALGWWIVSQVFSSIIKMYQTTKKTLETIGETPPSVANEVESLEAIMGILSSKVKTEFAQLKELSQKTDELNREISKKVFVLSTILQANDLGSKETPAEEVIQFLMQRLKQIMNMAVVACCLKNEGADQMHVLVALGCEPSVIDAAIEPSGQELKALIHILLFDTCNKLPLLAVMAEALGLRSLAVSPVIAKSHSLGCILVGNVSEDFTFSADEIDMLNLIAQNIAIVWEHKRLRTRVEELEVFDYLTGLYNERFMAKRLDEEIKRALTYQRPCGFLLMEIVNYGEYQRQHGAIEAEKLLKKISKIFKDTMRTVDIVGRTDTNALAAILIERNKRQSQEMARQVKEKITPLFADVTIQCAVTENPIDGTTAQSIMSAAQSLLGTPGDNETS